MKKKKSILEFAGAWKNISDKDIKEMKKDIRNLRKQVRKDLLRRSKRGKK